VLTIHCSDDRAGATSAEGATIDNSIFVEYSPALARWRGWSKWVLRGAMCVDRECDHFDLQEEPWMADHDVRARMRPNASPIRKALAELLGNRFKPQPRAEV